MLIFVIAVMFETLILAVYHIEVCRGEKDKQSFESEMEDTVIKGYQQAELEIVRGIAREVEIYIEEETVRRGIGDLPEIQQEAIDTFVKPVRMFRNGMPFIYTKERVLLNERSDFPEEYMNKTIYEIFYFQRERGADHYIHFAEMVMNGMEGYTWYVWLPEIGKEIAAFTNLTVNETTWVIGLSVPLSEIMSFTGAEEAIRNNNERVDSRLHDDKNTAIFLGVVFPTLLLFLAVMLFRLDREFFLLNTELENKNRELRESQKELERRVSLRTRRLRDTQEMLIHNQRLAAVGTMAAGIAHEINNPLTTIQNLIYLLRTEGELDPALMEYLELAEESTERINEIIKSLGTFARKENMARIMEIDIPEKFNNIFTVLGKRFDDHGIRLHIDLDDVKTIHASPSIQQVFVNIILNALDAMPHGGDLYIKAFSTRNSHIFEFTDTGKGMPPEVKNKIFEPFFTTKEPGKGTGLGLAISYGIIKQHRGRIEVESEPGKGTKFTVVIPSDLKKLKEELDIQMDIQGYKGFRNHGKNMYYTRKR